MIYTDAKNILFVSSSGHCSLDCNYCIASPVVKHQATLDYDDISYVLDKLSGKTALILSGKGDFFAGYKKNANLLSKVLDHDVDVALDINGVMIHEFPQLPLEKIAKIKHINLTMHYSQLVKKGALTAWARNAITIIKNQRCVDFIIGFILTPSEYTLWQEALDFFEREVFQQSNKSIVLIRDVLHPFESIHEDELAAVISRYSQLIDSTRSEDFASRFSNYPYVICPAGKNYFRIWNDGMIEGCPYITELANCGNAKSRDFYPRPTDYKCTTAKYCDCHMIASLDAMKYPDPEHSLQPS